VKDLDLAAINLTVDDRDPQAVFDSALSTFQALAPTARPRNGSVEVILLEAFATASADTIYALNRVITLAVEGVIGLYGVPRSLGTSAAGTVTLTLDGTRDLTVTAGQRLSEPTTGLVLLVTAATTVTGATTITVPVATEAASGAGNSITAGMGVDLLDAIPYVVSGAIATALTGGSDPESDASFIDRASTVLARVTSSLVLPSHFTAYALEDTRVLRATTVDLFHPGGTAGTDLGDLTVYVQGRGGALSAAVKAEIKAAMMERSSAMLTVYVEDADIVTQAITLAVVALPGYSTTTVRDDVTAALTAWMSPDVWTWGRDIMVTEIIDIAADVTGVDYVDTVTAPATTVTLTPEQLAIVGTITVTVS
jgi:uncharacterized phage protein gp47/JayE